MNVASKPTDLEDFAETIAIVGVGLIGGSIAAALKSRGFAGKVIGIGRNPERLKETQDRGLIDAFAGTVADVTADFWVFCTPVNLIAEGVRAVAAIPGKEVLITDAGSVKQTICEDVMGQLPKGVEFVGSHPLAGSERKGFEHADPELFQDRVCVVTPDDPRPHPTLDRVKRFWQFLGMQVALMDPEDHDLALAETSHLPHLVASALAATLQYDNFQFAATGFADTTRIAAGDPDLWTAIFMQNSRGTLSALSRFLDHLGQFRDALTQQDSTALKKHLQTAKTKRDKLP